MENRFETFTSLILQINRSVQKIKSIEMTEFDLKGIHAMCLYYLKQNPEGVSQSELAKLCQEDKAAISRALLCLRGRGLTRDTQALRTKKYNAKITLTAAGKSIAEKVCEKADGALNKGGTGLTESEREAFYGYLKKINDNLENYIGEGILKK